MKSRIHNSLPKLSAKEISEAQNHVKIATSRNAALVYETISKDHSLSREDIESELLYHLLLMTAEQGVCILSRFNYIQNALYNALVSFSRKVQSKKRQMEEGIELISINAQNYNDDDRVCEPEDPRGLGLENTAVARAFLDEILGQMSEDDRRLFVLLYVEGCTQREAARVFGVTQPMIYQRKRRIDGMFGLCEYERQPRQKP